MADRSVVPSAVDGATVSYHVTIDNSSLTTVKDDNDGDDGFHLDKFLWMYASPLIFLIGVVGNSLSVAVMRRRKFRGTTAAVYLPLLGLADTAVLFTGIIPEWLEYCDFVVFKELHPWTCKLEKFLFYTSGDTAIWMLVAFTFDRFVAVCFPLQKRVVCQPRRAVFVCLGILLAAISKNLHVFWTRGPQYDDITGEINKVCGRPHPHTYFEFYIRPWIAFSLVMALPFLIIIVCNVLIIRTLLRVQRMRSEQSSSDKGFLQTVAMCLSASFAFLIFIAPSIVLLIGKPYWTDGGTSHNSSYELAKAFNNQLVYVNHSINFFLYCFTGAKFREELVSLVKCERDRGGHSPLSYYNKSCYGAKDRVTPQVSATMSSRITDSGMVAVDTSISRHGTPRKSSAGPAHV